MKDLFILAAFFAIGFWKQRGAAPQTIKRCLVLLVFFIVAVTIFNLFNLPDNVREMYSEHPVLSGTIFLLTIFFSVLFYYGLFRLGMFCAKKYEQRKKEKTLEKELLINPEAESKYFSWENIDVPAQEYTMEMVMERIMRDILQSTTIFKNNEDIARHKKQVDLVDKIFLSAQKSLADGEPRLLGGMGGDTVKVLAMMEGTPFFFSLLPERKGPDGTVHRRGQIQVGDSKAYSITVIYELGLQTDDPAQWWKCKEPKQTFALTTRKKQECKEE